jgi:DNA polymerase
VVFGVGDESANLMFIGEAPGRQEDLQGEPFVGRSGKLLDRLVKEEIGLDRSKIYIANIVKCRPPNNRNPSSVEIENCIGYLKGQIANVQPKVIVGLGNYAVQSLLGTDKGISKLRGELYEFENIKLVPTFHPSYALRGGAQVVAQIRADLVVAKQLLNTLCQ